MRQEKTLRWTPLRSLVPLKVDDASFRATVKKVRFTSTETGIHYLSAKFGSEIVPGNPLPAPLLFEEPRFASTGTPIKLMINDARVVAAYGDGIHHALHEKPATFTIDTQDMQGDLKVRIEGEWRIRGFPFRENPD